MQGKIIAFLYGTIEEEVYVCQPPGFEDPDYPDKVYKVVKALYGLHQAPRAWYETLANYLLENGFQRGKIDQTLFIKRQKVKQKKDGIFISQDKYVAEILRKFTLTDRKSASTPIDTKKPLLKDPDVKKVNDVIRLQALVDKKKVVVMEATIRDALRFDDAEGVECKGFSGVETPLFECMVVAQEVGQGVADEVHDEGVHAAGIATEGVVSAANDEVPTADEEPSIPSLTPPTPPPQPSHDTPSTSQLKRRVKKLEKRIKVKVLKLRRLKRVGSAQGIDTSNDTVMDDVSNQGRIITDMDEDANVVLEEAKDVKDEVAADNAKVVQEEESEPVELQEVVDIVTTAKIITEVVTAASTTITAADVPIPAATTTAAPKLTVAPSRRTKGVVIRDPKESTTTTSTIIHSEAKSKDKGKGILVEEPKPLKKQAQIEQDEKYARELEAELNRTIDWDEVIDHVNKKEKEDKSVRRYQAMKRKPQTEAQARKNMMVYLKNVVGFKMDYFKGMTYDDICPVFEKHFDSNVDFLQKTKEQIDEEESRALKKINETPAEKAAKRQKLDDELILLVERRYPLTRFTLDQMLNNVRLEVEEESKVSLELISFRVDAAIDFKEKHSKCLMLLVKDLVLPSQVDAVD
nr:putative ribonuclease H-like domain-containing protein [Tanacetum cinerariifolium]